MSTAGQFDDDAFISYGSIDNQHVEDREKGRVDNFRERLTYKLGERLGYRPKVWRDSRMPGNVYFSDFLGEKIASTCVLVSVLSPGHIQSAWCMGEEGVLRTRPVARRAHNPGRPGSRLQGHQDPHQARAAPGGATGDARLRALRG